MRTRIFSLALLGTLSLLRAEETMQLPQGPLLNRAEIPSQWTITTQITRPLGDSTNGNSGNQTPEKKQTNPSVTTVLKGENAISEKTITENGAVIEIWRSDDWLAMNANSRGWIVSPNSNNNFNTTDYRKVDFAGFDWISLKNFTGRRDVMGKHCLVFKDKIVTMEPQELMQMQSALMFQYQVAHEKDHDLKPPVFNADMFKVEVEADIDDKTRLPVLLTYKTPEGVKTRTYTIQPASDSVSLPPEVKQLLQKYEENQRRLTGGMAPI